MSSWYSVRLHWEHAIKRTFVEEVKLWGESATQAVARAARESSVPSDWNIMRASVNTVNDLETEEEV